MGTSHEGRFTESARSHHQVAARDEYATLSSFEGTHKEMSARASSIARKNLRQAGSIHRQQFRSTR